MSNSRGSMEIMDVLSSIRRLVSEDRRADVAPRTEPVLTDPAEVQVPEAVADSLAAEAGAEPEAALPAPETGAEPAPVEAEVMMPSLAARRPGESRFVLTAALRVGDEGEPTAGSAEAAPPLADKGAGTRLSLESTIAELEAAVAGIEAEFEPDGGDEEAHAELAEAGPMPSWPLSERAPVVLPAIEAAAEPVAEVPDSQPTAPRGGFHGVMAGFDVMPPAEDRLDLPITGDITVPVPRRGDDWSAAGAGAGAASAFFRTAARPISATVEASPETLAAAPTAGAEAVAPAPEDSALSAFEAEVDDLADDAPPEEPEKEARSLSRPVIVRARGAEPAPATTEAGTDEDAADVPARADVDATEAGDADGADDLMAGGAEAEADEDGDLFDPLSGADLDIDMLRDMVAEIVRDELRGTLGERITRNLRALVRREIDRALIAEGLKRD